MFKLSNGIDFDCFRRDFLLPVRLKDFTIGLEKLKIMAEELELHEKAWKELYQEYYRLNYFNTQWNAVFMACSGTIKGGCSLEYFITLLKKHDLVISSIRDYTGCIPEYIISTIYELGKNTTDELKSNCNCYLPRKVNFLKRKDRKQYSIFPLVGADIPRWDSIEDYVWIAGPSKYTHSYKLKHRRIWHQSAGSVLFMYIPEVKYVIILNIWKNEF